VCRLAGSAWSGGGLFVSALLISAIAAGGCQGDGVGSAFGPGLSPDTLHQTTTTSASAPAQGGSYDGVTFTDDEAAAALDIANNGTNYLARVSEHPERETPGHDESAGRRQLRRQGGVDRYQELHPGMAGTAA
ncbi:hypothetical protein ACFL59_04115, partial [Planctomycetota bacterium]